MKTRLFLICVLVCVLSACAAPTPVPPTATPILPTATPVPPTPPPMPTATRVPPTPTLNLPTPTTASNVSATLTTTAPRVLPQATLRVGDLDRAALYYVPANLPRNAPLLLVFHGYGQDAEGIRSFTGYEFESLADQQGFIVVYPNGIQKSWNTCLKTVLPAKKQNADDVGLVRALIAKFKSDYGVDTTRVFATGYSNGSCMTYRLAIELADAITAIAAVGTTLPAEDNFDCRPAEKAIPVLIMKGTSDPMFSYDGGKSGAGNLLSTQATAEYFAKLNGQTSAPKTTRLTHLDSSDPTSADRIVWNDTGKPEVVLVRVNEGGHTIPHPRLVYPANTGRINRDLNGLAEIWEFFARQRPLK